MPDEDLRRDVDAGPAAPAVSPELAEAERIFAEMLEMMRAPQTRALALEDADNLLAGRREQLARVLAEASRSRQERRRGGAEKPADG